MDVDFQVLADRFPGSILFPEVNRPFRAGIEPLTHVQQVADLPSRLLFGDLVSDSFQKTKDGWSVEYRDQKGNGVDLKVDKQMFELHPFFLGTELHCFGRADQPAALGRHLSLGGGRVWGQALQKKFEAEYPLHVIPAADGQLSACMLPDGWLWTILVPVRASRLNNILYLHNLLAKLPEFSGSFRGSVRLQPGTVEYFEGGSLELPEDCQKLLIRQLELLETPIYAGLPERGTHEGRPIWKVERQGYVYRCTCFLRDLPRLVERLYYGMFLSRSPDLRAVLLPTELLLASQSLSWWSTDRQCRQTWSDFCRGELLGLPRTAEVEAEAEAAALTALQVSDDYMTAIGLRKVA